MGKIVLYGMDISPPVRACRLTLSALGVPYEYKVVNLMAGEHMTEDFLKHNPQHTVPVLDDNGTWIWDSHAICAYLVGKYGKSDDLYPKDLAKRAVVDQRLFFDASVLFPALRNVSMPMFRKNITAVPQEKVDDIVDGYNFVETFLGDNQFITGNTLTIADLSCAATVSSMKGVVDVDPKKYPKMVKWLERISKLPKYEEDNGKGVQQYVALLKSKLTFV